VVYLGELVASSGPLTDKSLAAGNGSCLAGYDLGSLP
jgi:hypothetical protein